ncbi:MAG TPA: GAF domain-containing protein [Actinocrinis sp.]|uniref:GAF domain-containing sensor histidine kinase n=1 Tax=Actinocrinis sp. TaxID=1920516 RepID=UPI002DDD2B3A|nr:GAF domain-containing protein [Actinocrinis sp.]HEV2347688.1 GAF domain-containing protein [Actinocrinis sp.]
MAHNDALADAAVLSRALAGLDDERAAVFALLDPGAATAHFAAKIPELGGVDMGWVGRAESLDHLVLSHVVNAATDNVSGLVVPRGAGLGGMVMKTGRPAWVSDYCTDPGITHEFSSQARAEGVKGMIAVPIIGPDGVLGVLYGANRYESEFGDRTVDALNDLAAHTAAASLLAERARHAAEVAVYEERRRLALELHDTVGATLFTLRAGIDRIAGQQHLDESTRDRLAALNRLTHDASAAVHGFTRVLTVPPQQAAIGVALREHCRALTERSGVDARVVVLTELPAMPYSRAGILADAARECLLNVEKHAHAKSVVVSVFAVRDGVGVTLSDDGVGLAENFAEHGGLGLAAMTARLTRAGGTVVIGPNEEGGVVVQLWVPA